jgi:hypothetical protein
VSTLGLPLFDVGNVSLYPRKREDQPRFQRTEPR